MRKHTSLFKPPYPSLIVLFLAVMFTYVAFGPVLELESKMQNIIIILSGFVLAGLMLFLVKKKKFMSFFSRFSIVHVFLLGVALRFLWLVFSNPIQTSDFLDYQNMAVDIMNGQYIFNPIKPTGASIITAMSYKLFGVHDLAALAPIVLLSSISILLIYGLCKHFFGKRTAIIVSLLFALLPEHIMYVNLIGSDVYFSFFILLGIYFLLVPKEKLYLAGISFGIAQYFRPLAFIPVLAAILFFFVVKKQDIKTSIKNSIIVIILFAVVVSPIVSYNQSELGIVSISPSQMGGWSMLLATNPEFKGQYNTDDLALLDAEVRARENTGVHDHVFRDNVAKELAIQRFKEHPGRYAMTTIAYKPLRFWSRPSLGWSLEGIESKLAMSILYFGATMIHRMLLVLSMILLVLHFKKEWWKNEGIYFMLFYTVLVFGSHLLLEVQPRYHHVLLPVLVIMFGALIKLYQPLTE
ncbi:hypothetical protein GOV09_05955 [Candidatus Woesearchaeota archaeon]|nr:hypothetical protein [Candidatus Woesearchaeota archaeon]